MSGLRGPVSKTELHPGVFHHKDIARQGRNQGDAGGWGFRIAWSSFEGRSCPREFHTKHTKGHNEEARWFEAWD